MQERRPYNITPDQGWVKMKPILDEAMPVEPRQRRSGYFWWATSTLLIFGVIALGFVKGTDALLNSPAKSQVELDHSGNNSLPLKAEVKAAFPSPSSKPNQAINNTSIETGEQTSPEINPTAIPPSEIMPSQSMPSEPQPALKTANKEQTIPMAYNDMEDEARKIGMTEEEVSSRASEVQAQVDHSLELHSQAIAFASTQRNSQAVELIPSLSGVGFLTPYASQASVPSIVVDKSRRRPSFLEPTIAVSGLIGPDGGSGYYGGAGLNANVSKRFAFTAGIGYISFGPEASLFGGTQSLDAANPEYAPILQHDPTYYGNETYLDSKYINSSIGYNVISPLVERVNQWQVDIGVKWKFSGRFYTDAGVKLGFHTKAYSEYPIINEISNVGTSFPAVVFDNSLNTYDVIRSNTTSVYAGIGYRFGDHLEVFSNWTHAFDEYLLNENINTEADSYNGSRTDYIRGLSLGLRYTL